MIMTDEEQQQKEALAKIEELSYQAGTLIQEALGIASKNNFNFIRLRLMWGLHVIYDFSHDPSNIGTWSASTC